MRAFRTITFVGAVGAAVLAFAGSGIAQDLIPERRLVLTDNTDLPGFTLDELHRLSQLVLGHRGKLRKLELALEDVRFVQQLMALRLAVILCHARRDPDLAGLDISCDDLQHTVRLKISPAWAELWPQSAHLLREEKTAWQKTDWTFQVQTN